MASSGWLKVAAGFRMVASAATTQAAEQGSVLAGRVANHGADMAIKARTAATAVEFVESVMKKTAAMEVPTPMQHAPIVQDRTSAGKQAKEEQANTGYRTTESPPQEEVFDSMPVKESEPDLDTSSSMADSMLSSNENRILSRSPQSPPSDSESLYSTPRYERLKEGRKVPATRTGRAVGFASLGARLAFGTASELTSRIFGMSSSTPGSPAAATDANADRLAAALCRMRGAALKLGQMLSIQDESLLPPALTRALEQVRQGADAMPNYQLVRQLESQLGKDWRDKFEYFDELPFAAASIGQVHRARIRDGDEIKNVIIKVQYPGVADSIESDLRNISMLVTLTGLAPKGLFIENVIRVGRDELKVECDYIREMKNQQTFKELVETDPQLSAERFKVPAVYKDMTTTQVLTAEYVPGGTIDKVAELDQEERNRIAYNLLYLTVEELFTWRFMQTDPNWGNFLYDVGSRTTYLIDFGAAREFSKSFVDGYLRIVCANANRDEETLMAQSHKMNFLTGEENDIMREAHKMSGFTVGEPFWSDEPFDFRGSRLSSRLSEHSSAFLQHRLTPPPEEVYTLHRKLAGAYNLCIKLGAVIPCRELLRRVVAKHSFEDGMEPPTIP